MIKSDFGEISSREYGKGFVISACEVSSPDYASHTLLKSILQFEHRLVIQIWSTPGNHPAVIGAHGPQPPFVTGKRAAVQLHRSRHWRDMQHPLESKIRVAGESGFSLWLDLAIKNSCPTNHQCEKSQYAQHTGANPC